MSKALLKKRFKEIQLIHDSPVTLRSGITANYYCDMKKAYGYPDILNLLVEEIGKKLKKSITCVAGSGYGGLPIAAVVASKYNLKFVAVRNEPKKHGKGGEIDGYVPTKKDKVLIIDDVLTTGNSIKGTLAPLRKIKANVVGALVIVKRTKVRLSIPVDHIFKVEELIE